MIFVVMVVLEVMIFVGDEAFGGDDGFGGFHDGQISVFFIEIDIFN